VSTPSEVKPYSYFKLNVVEAGDYSLDVEPLDPSIAPTVSFSVLPESEQAQEWSGAAPAALDKLNPGLYFIGVGAACTDGKYMACGEYSQLRMRVRVRRAGAMTRGNASVPKTAAVLPFSKTGVQFSIDQTHLLEESVRTIAAEHLASRGFTVLAGETTLAVLTDNGVDASKVCEANCALTAARELKAAVFVSVSIAKEDDEMIGFVRVFESASGRQLASTQIEGATPKLLRKSFEAKAQKLLSAALEQLDQL
jgi:hypothetical protein